MKLGLCGAPHWVTRGTHPGSFNLSLNNVTRTEGGACRQREIIKITMETTNEDI